MTGAGSLIDLTGDDMQASLRLAMVTRFPPSCSGAAEAAADLAETLVSRFGIDVEVIRLVPLGEHAAPGRPVVMELNPGWRLGGEAASARAGYCDVVLVQLERPCPVDLVGELINRSEIPVVLLLDDVAPTGIGDAGAIAALAKRADAVVVPSTTARERIHEQTSGSVRAEVIPHGSSWSALQPRQGIRRHILTWGFMSPGMGVERVIQALALLGDIEPAPHYRIIGVAHPSWSNTKAARHRRELLETAEALGVGDCVEFGPVLHSREELFDEVRKSDILAVMYGAQDRTASRILTEAVSTGRPVVATRFPGAVELLASGAGLTVAHEDTAELAMALRRLLTDDEAYLEAAKAARSLSPSLGWDSVAGRFFDLLMRMPIRGKLDSAAKS
ncbi:MAG: glycosyltransferase [Acidobacteria bacterium]|nr:glycosyltransferase [Acidobacteriota bacterium]